MPNKFQKSVQERQSAQAPPTVHFTGSDQGEKTKPSQPDLAKKTIDPSVINPVIDVEKYLRPSFARLAKNKTFYLDEEVISALKVVAQSQRVTDSKLANDILRTVLLEQK